MNDVPHLKEQYRIVWNPFDSRWKILHDGFAIVDASSRDEALISVRSVTNEPIYEKDVIILGRGESYEA